MTNDMLRAYICGEGKWDNFGPTGNKENTSSDKGVGTRDFCFTEPLEGKDLTALAEREQIKASTQCFIHCRHRMQNVLLQKATILQNHQKGDKMELFKSYTYFI